MKKKLWLVCEARYEQLPYAVFDTLREVACFLNVSRETLKSQFSKKGYAVISKRVETPLHPTSKKNGYNYDNFLVERVKIEE